MMEVPCRSCGGTDLVSFLDLDTTPLPDFLLDPGADLAAEEWYPLEVAFCPDCALVQITEEVSAEKMFVDNYHYYSSFSDHLLKHSREHAFGLIAERVGRYFDGVVAEDRRDLALALEGELGDHLVAEGESEACHATASTRPEAADRRAASSTRPSPTPQSSRLAIGVAPVAMQVRK